MLDCKTPIYKRVWARKLVRWLGFLVYPDYDVEDVEIETYSGTKYRITNEDDHYYYAIVDNIVITLFKPNLPRSCTFITGKVFYEKILHGCYIVDSEEEFQQRLKESELRVCKKRGW